MLNLIKDTYNGKSSFVDTMIFFGIFGVSFFIILLFSLSNQYSYFLVTHKPLIYILVGFIMTYTIFLTLSLYRSSKKDKKLSLLAIAIEVTILALLTSYFVKTVYNPNNIFESSILSLNSKLPAMIDSDTRFEKVSIEKGNICYHYTVINQSSKNINKDLFTLITADKIQRVSPLDKMILNLSKKKRVISYIFKDKDANLITKVDIKGTSNNR